DNPRIRQLNEQGQPVYELTSDKATHQVNSDITELDEPRLQYYREGEQTPWQPRARYGEVTSQGDQVLLSQNVIIEQQLDPRDRNNPRIRQVNEQGQPVYELTSDKATHQVNSDITELDEPRLQYYREGEQTPWQPRARYGEVTSQGDQVLLSQNVIIEQQLDP